MAKIMICQICGEEIPFDEIGVALMKEHLKTHQGDATAISGLDGTFHAAIGRALLGSQIQYPKDQWLKLEAQIQVTTNGDVFVDDVTLTVKRG